MRLSAPLAIAAAALALPASVLAQEQHSDSRTYFTARITERTTPQQLTAQDREYYDQVFTAIGRSEWSEVERLLAERPTGLLHDVARAEYYLAANSPRVEADQISRWLETGYELPQAPQLVRLGQTRGLSGDANLPYARDMVSQRSIPRRTRPRPINDGTMPSDVRAAILDRITRRARAYCLMVSMPR